MQVINKLKFVEKKTTIQKEICPKITFLPFFSKTFRKPLKIAEKIIFINRKINLNIQNLKIIPYNQKKMQFQHGALFLQFSIFSNKFAAKHLCQNIFFQQGFCMGKREP